MANRPPYPGTPRWVKVFGIIVIVVILLTPLALMVLRRRGRDLGMLGEALEGADESDHPSLAAQTSDGSRDATSTTVPPGPSPSAGDGASDRPRG